MQRPPLIQDTVLDHLCENRIEVMMFLVNGIRLLGQIEQFDKFTVVLVRGNSSQLIYKHAISAINPAMSLDLADPT
ncbi:RNA chaperone Hfq [Microvirga zambiensis]|uniref:RNA chaperone Hfq n=1 Tax=Microvirga zambiensis TaxID=1402137 RepID=UPI00191CCB72|nr:RNA chaperone Hfq [Microvirga zambiensis]